MNKRQRKKQAARKRFQLWLDGSSEGMFDSPRKAKRYLEQSYVGHFRSDEYDIIDLPKFNEEYFSDKKACIVIEEE